MNFVFYVPHFKEGGLERSTTRLAEEVVRRGGRALLVTLRGDGKMLPEWPDAECVRVLGSRSAFTSIPALSRLLRRENIDVLVSAQDHANVSAVIARMLSRRTIPLILTERVSLTGSMKARGLFRRTVLARMVKWAYPKADVVVANSQDGAREVEEYMGWTRGRVETIYNPTVGSTIAGMAAEEVSDPWFAADEVPVVMGLGRLDEQKDFATLVRAVAVVRMTQECRLVIFGDGSLRDGIAGLATELEVAQHVRLEGFVENPYKYLSRSQAFVLSSRYEGLPNALIEAQACGVPAISTDCPTGPREILEDGKSGALVPVGDHVAMAEAIIRVLSDKELGESYVSSANAALDRFTPKSSYLQYEALVEAVHNG